MATLLYCERGACGPDGAGWRSAAARPTFFSVSRRPPLVGGATGVAGLPAAIATQAGVEIEAGLAVVARKPGQEQAGDEEAGREDRGVRVSRLAVPRLDMKPAPPPTPRPPPSDFCSSTAPISVATIMR